MLNFLRRSPLLVGGLIFILWSTTAVMCSELSQLPPFQVTAIVFSLGFLTQIALSFYLPSSTNLSNIPLRYLSIGVIALTINQLGYLIAFRWAPPEQVDLVYYLWPMLTFLFLPNRLSAENRNYMLALMIGFVSMAVLLAPSIHTVSSSYLMGYASAFVSGLAWAGYSAFSSRFKNLPSTILGWSAGPSAVITWLIHFKTETFIAPSYSLIGQLLLIGVGSVGCSLSLWERCVKQGNTPLLSVLAYFIPILSIGLLVLFKKSQFTPHLLIACLLVSLAAWIAQPKSQQSPQLQTT